MHELWTWILNFERPNGSPGSLNDRPASGSHWHGSITNANFRAIRLVYSATETIMLEPSFWYQNDNRKVATSNPSIRRFFFSQISGRRGGRIGSVCMDCPENTRLSDGAVRIQDHCYIAKKGSTRVSTDDHPLNSAPRSLYLYNDHDGRHTILCPVSSEMLSGRFFCLVVQITVGLSQSIQPSTFTAPGAFPTSVYQKYFNSPTATSAQVQPVISDPVTVCVHVLVF